MQPLPGICVPGGLSSLRCAAVKLLEVRHDKDFGAVWTGIRVHDELAAEQVLVEPKESHQGRYLQLSHVLAPEVRLNSTKRSKHDQLPKSGTKARCAGLR